VDRIVLIAGHRYEIPPGWFAGSSAAFVLLLTPPLALLARRLKLSSASKMACGVALSALSFAILWAATVGRAPSAVSPIWLVAHYLTMSAGEILLGPIGLSVVSKLSPPRWAGVLFGVWYISTAAGNFMAGSVIRLWLKWPHARFFAFLALLLLAVTGVLISQLGWLRRTLPQDDNR
jgi:POT family proton-dependent oligopeptide transporter